MFGAPGVGQRGLLTDPTTSGICRILDFLMKKRKTSELNLKKGGFSSRVFNELPFKLEQLPQGENVYSSASSCV